MLVEEVVCCKGVERSSSSRGESSALSRVLCLSSFALSNEILAEAAEDGEESNARGVTDKGAVEAADVEKEGE